LASRAGPPGVGGAGRLAGAAHTGPVVW